MTSIPADLITGSSKNTGYEICKNSNNRITVTARDSENGKLISVNI